MAPAPALTRTDPPRPRRRRCTRPCTRAALCGRERSTLVGAGEGAGGGGGGARRRATRRCGVREAREAGRLPSRAATPPQQLLKPHLTGPLSLAALTQPPLPLSLPALRSHPLDPQVRGWEVPGARAVRGSGHCSACRLQACFEAQSGLKWLGLAWAAFGVGLPHVQGPAGLPSGWLPGAPPPSPPPPAALCTCSSGFDYKLDRNAPVAAAA